MANTKIRELTELSIPATSDYLEIVDVSDTTFGANGTNKQITRNNFLNSFDIDSLTATATELNTLDGITATVTELNYTDGVTSAIQTQLNGKATNGANSDITSLSGLSTPLSVAQGGTGVATLTSNGVLVGAGTSAVTTSKAAPTGDFVGVTDSQTLTNKTLTAPVINSPYINASVQGSAFLDDDTMATATSTTFSSSESIKAYVDNSIAALSLQSDGWISDSNTWTYASSSTFTVSGNVTSTFTKGTKIWYSQSGSKWAVVTNSSYSAPNTTVTITDHEYNLVNVPIDNPYYSYQESPAGFPEWFSFSTTWGGFSANPTGTWAYMLKGKTCFMRFVDSASGTSNATTLTFTAPVAPLSSQSVIAITAVSEGQINQPTMGHIQGTAGSTTLSVYKTFYQGAWTSSGTKNIFPGTFCFRWA